MAIPMSKGTLIFAAVFAGSLALIALFSPQLQPKREALGAVIGSLFTGANHPLAVLESSDVRHELPQLHLPTHLSYGQRDALTPIGAARWLASTIAGSTLTEFPQASHAPFLSHEAEFVADLIPFLRRHA